MRISFRRVDWPFASTFKISYQSQTHAQTVVVELEEQGLTGRGEGLAVSYRGETADMLMRQLSVAKDDLTRCRSRQDLQNILPPGGARCAVDCAMWDLEAKRSNQRAWEMAGLASVRPLITAYTLSLDTPEAMSAAAAAVPQHSLLKLKLDGTSDVERVTAVHATRPDAQIIVDANQAWSERELHEITPRLAKLGVRLIEQPLPVGKDDSLLKFSSPVPLCADESCQTSESLASLAGKYRYVNIKLDKTGGLTEGLKLAQLARDLGIDLMVGCMAGSSLSMAPAFIIGQLCSVVDLDGPLLSSDDVPNGIRYEGSRMFPPDRSLWG